MRRRSIIWPVLAVIFTLGNVAGAVYAAAMGEIRHASLHVLLSVVGALVSWALIGSRGSGTGAGALRTPGSSGELGSHLSNLEQSLDAIAVEVERVGENQRYMTKVLTEQERTPDDTEHG